MHWPLKRTQQKAAAGAAGPCSRHWCGPLACASSICVLANAAHSHVFIFGGFPVASVKGLPAQQVLSNASNDNWPIQGATLAPGQSTPSAVHAICTLTLLLVTLTERTFPLQQCGAERCTLPLAVQASGTYKGYIGDLFASAWSSTLNADGASKRLLVLLDNLGIRESHSFYFKQLTDRGFDITYKSSDDSNLQIVKYGEYLYENIIIFAPATKEFGGRLDSEILTQFVDAGGNVLVAGSNTVGDAIREFAGECGIEFADDKSAVIDHLNYDTNDNGQHTLIVASPDNLLPAEIIVGQSKKNALPFLFRGIGMSSDQDNPLLLDILTGSSSSYTANPEEATLNEYPATVGKRTLLISVLQARNNARVGFVGSLDFFSNDFFQSSIQANNGKKHAKSGNEDLAVALTDWVFKQRGVLRARNIRHYLKSDKSTPRFYTVKNDIVFNVQFDEFVHGKWMPFNGTDVQLEFVRIDPFVRTTLKNKAGQLEAQFRVPDTYGIFKFVIDYNRVGYTHLYSATQVSVHPLRHTEYERFISSAYPYYISSFSMMVGAFLLSFIVLYHRDEPPKKKAE